jgi:hypothetical protein
MKQPTGDLAGAIAALKAANAAVDAANAAVEMATQAVAAATETVVAKKATMRTGNAGSCNGPRPAAWIASVVSPSFCPGQLSPTSNVILPSSRQFNLN